MDCRMWECCLLDRRGCMCMLDHSGRRLEGLGAWKQGGGGRLRTQSLLTQTKLLLTWGHFYLIEKSSNSAVDNGLCGCCPCPWTSLAHVELSLYSVLLFPFAWALATWFHGPAGEPSPQSFGDCAVQGEHLLWPQEDMFFSLDCATHIFMFFSSYLTSLSLTFLICKVGMILSTSVYCWWLKRKI